MDIVRHDIEIVEDGMKKTSYSYKKRKVSSPDLSDEQLQRLFIKLVQAEQAKKVLGSLENWDPTDE